MTGLYQDLDKDEALFLSNSPADKHLYLNLISDLLSSAPLKFNALFPRFEGMTLEVNALVSPTKTTPLFTYTPAQSSSDIPARLQVNLENMRQHPLYEVEAKTFFYGIPGIHLLTASEALRSSSDPSPFTPSDVPAFTLGWGLYVAGLAREHELYRSQYGELGSLIIENRSAAILVADLRLNQKTWNNEQAMTFLQREGFMTTKEASSIVALTHSLPVSQTSAFAGLLTFKALRAKAQQQPGKTFNLAEFHQQILLTGPLPLPFVEEEISAWLSKK